MVAGPYEPAMGELVVNEQYKQRIERCIDEHFSSENLLGKQNDYNFSHFDCYHTHKVKCRFNSDGDDILMKHRIVISYPRSGTSKVRGLKNRNILYFQEMYPQFSIDWCEDNTRNTVRCCIDGLQYML